LNRCLVRVSKTDQDPGIDARRFWDLNDRRHGASL
jgi:hypothetical protein